MINLNKIKYDKILDCFNILYADFQVRHIEAKYINNYEYFYLQIEYRINYDKTAKARISNRFFTNVSIQQNLFFERYSLKKALFFEKYCTKWTEYL